MKNLPHDYYLKFNCSTVMDDVLQFHTKGNFVIHDSVKHISRLHTLAHQDLNSLSGNELQLYPDMDITLTNVAVDPLKNAHPLLRNSSCDFFEDFGIPLKTLIELLRPLVRKSKSTHKRGYPSAGALYPVEVLCCSLTTKNNWPYPDNFMHLLSNSRKIEISQTKFDPQLLKEALLPSTHSLGTPSIALIYVMYMPKILFKYRYRGYRMALMEVGSMYMLVDLQCKSLNLKSRQWSGFTDSMICKSLGLNPSLFFPACVQFIGGEQ
jgi:SagB-type dehydrogenase family enzyme